MAALFLFTEISDARCSVLGAQCSVLSAQCSGKLCAYFVRLMEGAALKRKRLQDSHRGARRWAHICSALSGGLDLRRKIVKFWLT